MIKLKGHGWHAQTQTWTVCPTQTADDCNDHRTYTQLGNTTLGRLNNMTNQRKDDDDESK